MINHKQGFTLIELMVVVAIIGIISALAFPSYDNYVKKSKRADAKVALTTIADRQERHYLQNNIYSATLAALNVNAVSEEGYYNLSIDFGTAAGFKATATRIVATDPDCLTLSIDSVGAKTATGADPSKCW